MAEKEDISENGIYCAVALAMFGTVGYEVTTGRLIEGYNWIWVSAFTVAFFVLSGAAVNFKLERWLA